MCSRHRSRESKHQSQPDNWRSLFQSAKEVLVTSFEISDIRRCARDGFLGASQSNTKPRETQFLLSCWHNLNLWEGGGSKFSVTGQVIIILFWDCEGVILVDTMPKRADNQMRRLQQDAESTREVFQTSLASQKSNRNPASITTQGPAHV